MIFWVPFSSLPVHFPRVNVLVTPVPCPVSSHVSEIGVNHPLRSWSWNSSEAEKRGRFQHKRERGRRNRSPPQHLKKITHLKVLPRVRLEFDYNIVLTLAAFLLNDLKFNFHMNRLHFSYIQKNLIESN